MAELAIEQLRGTFATLRDTFRGISARHDRTYCQWMIADDTYRERLTDHTTGEWSENNIIAYRGFALREPDVCFVSPEQRQQILDRMPDAEFYPNSAGDQVYYRQPGIQSSLHFRGDHVSYSEFDSVARDAGFCLVRLLSHQPVTLRLPELVPYDSIAKVRSTSGSTRLPGDLTERWIAFLHALGWQNVTMSPLRAERRVWLENTAILGDPEELHKFLDAGPFARLKEKLPIPPRYFASTLLSDVNLSSVYAIDALLSGILDRIVIDVQSFSSSLASIPPGPDGSSDFHKLVVQILQLLFEPDLQDPIVEARIHDGRGRVDIVFTNYAETGYFADIAFRHLIRCPVVFFECKNYSSDLGPTEFAQLVTRFGEKRSKVGLYPSGH